MGSEGPPAACPPPWRAGRAPRRRWSCSPALAPSYKPAIRKRKCVGIVLDRNLKVGEGIFFKEKHMSFNSKAAKLLIEPLCRRVQWASRLDPNCTEVPELPRRANTRVARERACTGGRWPGDLTYQLHQPEAAFKAVQLFESHPLILLVSWCPGVLVSWCLGVLVFLCPCFLLS